MYTVKDDTTLEPYYYAYLHINEKEAYLFCLKASEKLLKYDWISLLKSIRRRPLQAYEKIELENIVVSSNDGIDLVLKEGYYTNDSELWNAFGPKWVGDFEIHVKKGDHVVKTSLNPLWAYENLFFYAPEFTLKFKDYNGDGLMDFALSQYAASNIDYYMLFTILEDGNVIKTPFEEDFIIGSTSRDNSSFLKLENNHLVSKFYDNTVGNYYKDYYEWDGQKYIHTQRQALDD